MPGNYNCYECKKAELEKVKSEFDDQLEKMKKTIRIREGSSIKIQKKKYVICLEKIREIGTYKYTSLAKISNAVFNFNKQKLNEILGEKKATFLFTIKSFQKQFQENGKLQEDKLKKDWLSEFVRSFVHQKKHSNNEYIKLFSLNKDDNSVHKILIDILYQVAGATASPQYVKLPLF